ncbi:MAG TPA: DUF559 domain-containing protein, partial [Candidatus Wallbacteria bacterium]|nr:DUF559 domain-containing protein [Candidatus Wallbacteria bacterium]
NNPKINELIDALNQLFNFKIISIYNETVSHTKNWIYKFDYSDPLPPDSEPNKMVIFKCVFNNNYFENIVQSPDKLTTGSPIYEISKKIELILKQFFLTSNGDEIINFKIYSTGKYNEILRYKKKRKYSNQFVMPHQNSNTSKIEEIFKNALQNNKIEFDEQYEILSNDKTLSIVDFHIKNTKILIYCDGYKFHSDESTMLKDKKQDRLLQYYGYKVLRFMGSEIVGNIDECIMEVNLFIRKFGCNS